MNSNDIKIMDEHGQPVATSADTGYEDEMTRLRRELAESERQLRLFKSEQKRADRLEDERDAALEMVRHARARARRLWRYCLSWAPTNDAWREVKHETQAESGDWINE